MTWQRKARWMAMTWQAFPRCWRRGTGSEGLAVTVRYLAATLPRKEPLFFWKATQLHASAAAHGKMRTPSGAELLPRGLHKHRSRYRVPLGTRMSPGQ